MTRQLYYTLSFFRLTDALKDNELASFSFVKVTCLWGWMRWTSVLHIEYMALTDFCLDFKVFLRDRVSKYLWRYLFWIVCGLQCRCTPASSVMCGKKIYIQFKNMQNRNLELRHSVRKVWNCVAEINNIFYYVTSEGVNIIISSILNRIRYYDCIATRNAFRIWRKVENGES